MLSLFADLLIRKKTQLIQSTDGDMEQLLYKIQCGHPWEDGGVDITVLLTYIFVTIKALYPRSTDRWDSFLWLKREHSMPCMLPCDLQANQWSKLLY